MRFSSIPFLAAATPSGGGGGGAEYLETTFAAGSSGTATPARPAGADASSTLYAILSGIDETALNAMTLTGWTAVATLHGVGPYFRVMSAAGDVASLAFSASSITGALVVGFNGTVNAVAALGHSYAANDAVNVGSPSVVAEEGDLILSAYYQAEIGGGTFPNSIQSGYAREYLRDGVDPMASVVSRSGVSAGATGTIQHGSAGQYTPRATLTLAIGA